MSKVIQLRAPESMRLTNMKPEEIAERVAAEAGRMLDQLPGSIRPAAVSSISLETSQREAAEIGGWGEWSRARCDRRRDIHDSEIPQEHELQEGISFHAPEFNHFDSAFTVKRITEDSKSPMSKGFVHLATRPGVMLLPCLQTREGRGICARFEEPVLLDSSQVDPEWTEQMAAQLIASMLEGLISRSPAQWLLLPTLACASPEMAMAE